MGMTHSSSKVLLEKVIEAHGEHKSTDKQMLNSTSLQVIEMIGMTKGVAGALRHKLSNVINTLDMKIGQYLSLK